MTLVEVMVAMVVLVVGVLGVATMLDTGNKVTRDNVARDGATGLAREQLERVREMTYASLADPSSVATGLIPAIGDSSSTGAATFTTVRRNVTYTTTITSCVLDDPSDGIGVVKGTPCTPLPSGSGGGGTVPVAGSSGSLLGLNVLGIQLTGTGNVVDAVCSLLGRNSVLDSLVGQGAALSGLISTGADVGVCSSNAQVAVDRQPSDATAVTTTVSWSSPRSGRVVQRAVVSGPRVATP
jgi:type II secretory pathway pseudopilin PulG